MGHLVRCGTRHQPRSSVPAEHHARCHGGRLLAQHLPETHRPPEDGQYRPDRERAAGHGPYQRFPDGPDADIPRVPDVQRASGSDIRSDRLLLWDAGFSQRTRDGRFQRLRLTRCRRCPSCVPGQSFPGQVCDGGTVLRPAQARLCFRRDPQGRADQRLQ